MTQESKQPIDLHLSVHESTDPNLLRANPEQEPSGKTNELDDSVHDDENVDVHHPGMFDPARDENVVDSQISIANLSAG